MNLKNIRDNHRLIFEKIGIQDVDTKHYETCVQEVLTLLISAHKQINETEKERFAKELYKLPTHRKN